MSAEQTLRDQIIQKAWEDEAFKKQLLTDPKVALKEAFDIDIPDSIELEAVEESPSKYYLILPQNPSEVKAEEESIDHPMWV